MPMLKSNKWWSAKIPPILAVVYYAVGRAPSLPRVTTTLSAVALMITGAAAIAGLGYFITDAFDVTEDLVTGRPNLWGEMPAQYRAGVLAGLLLIAGVSFRLLAVSRMAYALVAGEFVLFLLYAAPPIRLKIRGIAGIVTDALFAHVFPMMVAWVVFSRVAGAARTPWVAAVLIGWSLSAGMRHLLHHQAIGIDDDRRAGVATFAVRRGREATFGLIVRLLPVEVALCLTAVTLLSPSQPLIAVAFVAHIARETFRLRTMTSPPVHPFGWLDDETRAELWGRTFLSHFYSVWLPLALLLALCMQSRDYVILLILHALLFNRALRPLLVLREVPVALSRLRRAF